MFFKAINGGMDWKSPKAPSTCPIYYYFNILIDLFVKQSFKRLAGGTPLIGSLDISSGDRVKELKFD